MPLIETLLPEFDREMGQTRKLIERAPEDQFDWKPHPSSMTLGRLAGHLTELPGWASTAMTSSAFEVPPDRPPDDQRPASRAAVLALFDDTVTAARRNLAGKTDAEFLAPWTLTAEGKEVFTMPKIAMIRTFVLNHMVHHRGQMSVYLRMLGVKIPSIYGPSGDERM